MPDTESEDEAAWNWNFIPEFRVKPIMIQIFRVVSKNWGEGGGLLINAVVY